ncbi:DUF1924 domain-containing protein [Magnetovibrio blakemorei]|uniref:DUF1924 domain-containing protein n=1 Tax=Magnetovibrio blakemorei TaxID=28181 RepID=UPI000A05C8E4|nr:DUF1924 domain-containing protein [Magnetovibrio blakemorei]
MKSFKVFLTTVALATVISATVSAPAFAGPREDIIAGFMAQGAGPADLANGKHMYDTTFATGKPDTPKCTTCHGATPQEGGQTRTGKAIEPMAVSKTPARFTDQAKVDKWFLRNCSGVIGRECTAQEKVDFISYLASQ